MGSTRRVRTHRTVRLQRPPRTGRPVEESLRLWSRRRTYYTLWAVGWAILAAVFSFTDGGWLAVSLCLVAAVLSTAAALKAVVLVSRSRGTD